MLNFRILGAIEIGSPAGSLRPKGALQRALLMAFLANSCKLVPTQTLIDELWDCNPPDRVENALQAHVSRLRRQLVALEPDSAPRLLTHPSGYRLIVEDDELDIATFLNGLDRLRQQRGTAAEIARETRALLALWRGPAFGGFTGGPIAQAAAGHYEESYLSALELLFDCELENGNHQHIVPELRRLLVKHPYKERFRQQLMVALYRAGRQADALDVYQDLRHQLSDDLGLTPSPIMREYERAVLEQDPVLTSVDPQSRGIPLTPAPRRQLHVSG
ncbi:BTAD domain-containing putative transcriptional regulator [Streptomyces sp. NPDC053048]|uniref:AfsR/SARP family transcriptional regulator n=1 Tax=Streptomyces sp. NPDC053048 TaxID=3365694 RepID=UPI0037D30CA9